MKKSYPLFCLTFRKPGITLIIFSIIFFQSFLSYSQASEAFNWSSVPIGGGGFVSAIIPSKTQEGLIYARTDVGGAYRWDPDNSKWIPLNDWVSEDQTGYLGVESMAIDPQNPNRVYMLVGISYFNSGATAILKSDDYGDNFTIINVNTQFKAHGNGMGRQSGEKLVVDPHNSNVLYCGTRWNGLFKSTDAGLTWSRVNSLNVTTTPNENGVSFVVLDESTVSGGNTQTMFVGVSQTGTNLYRSDDGGQTFTAIPNAPTNYMPHRAALDGAGNLYITYGNGAGPHAHWSLPEPMDAGQIWKYNISTGAWTNVTPSGYTRAFGGISVDPGNPNRLVASTINTYMAQGSAWGDRIFISTNGGASWTDVIGRGFALDANGSPWISGHAIHWAGSIEFDPFNTSKVWVTSGNGIFTTDNIDASTTTWRFEVDNLEETVPLELVSIEGGPVVSVIGDYDGFRHTDITQYAPIHTPRMGTTTGLDYARQNPDVLVRVGNNMYYSTDMALTWTQCSMNGQKGEVAVSADGSTFLHCPESSTTTYRSTNNGSSWTTVTGLSINEAYPVADPVNSNKFYAYNSSTGNLMISTNGGASFTTAGSPGTGGSKHIKATHGIEGDLWIPMMWGGLKHSTNSGQSYTTINGVSYCGAVGIGKAAEGKTYPTIFIWGTVNGTKGVFRSTDQGATWIRVNDDDHEYGGPGNGQFVIGDMNVFGRVYMSTAGRGIAMGNPAGTGNLSPSVSISSPADNSVFTAPADINIEATATDTDGNITSVSFYNGNTLLGTDNTSPYTYTWTGLGAGTYTITAVATDNEGASTTSAAISITVSSDQVDCAGVPGGDAYTDNCGVCVGGNTGVLPCADITDGNYTISPVSSGLCLEPAGQVSQETCDNTISQVFSITRNGDNYEFYALELSQYLGDGAGIQGNYISTTSTAVSLRIEDAGNGSYHLVPVSNTGVVFDIDGNQTTPGAGVLLWARTGGSNQRFILTPSSIVTGTNSTVNKKSACYPNPFANELLIESPGTFTYSVYDAKGNILEKGSGEGIAKAGNNLQPGLYMIKIESDQHVEVFKVNKR